MKTTIVQDICEGRLEAAIAYRSDLVIAFADHDPINRGHLLICPVQPYESLLDLPANVDEEIQRVAKVLYARVMEHYQPDGISFIQNNGAFNELTHYHLHLFPRYHGDQFGWSSSELGIQSVEALKKEILPICIEPTQVQTGCK
ncbi:HIT family hydrolase [Vibrio sp. qd031]|uniref:HIT family protein n=1 Tax=Vibrio sp. qd031 TaxID=1603038 RepID=UPI000A10924A|nr:HIT family protein [Vibrio sp. qd031]ORT48596.1 HIT family hydrolase [Vibrio sp. qd031]